nr:hypothetical protein [Acidimicrobiia bacterium]
ELARIERRVGLALGRPDAAEQQRQLVEWVERAGLDLVATAETDEQTFELAPADLASKYEQRVLSMLFDLDDETFAAVVQPAIDELRALPEPDRPRPRVQVHDIVVAGRRP